MTSTTAPGNPENPGNSSNSGDTDQRWVHFAEQRGNLPALQQLVQAWVTHPGMLSAEVLHSPAQASGEGELYLLVTRWQGAVPPLVLPAGAKGWAFAVLPQAVQS